MREVQVEETTASQTRLRRRHRQTYAILEVFAIAGVLYLLINLVLITIIRLLEARLTRYLPR